MALSPAERRFLRSWEEQRAGGKSGFVAMYTLAYTLVIFLCGVAVALFGNLPFVRLNWLVSMAIGAVILAFFISLLIWHQQQTKWRRIINREIEANN